MKRSKTGQKRHDAAVRKSADWYGSRGYSVQADVPGRKQPKTIEKRRPDIIAKKGREEVIVEVETKQSADADKEQQRVFREYAKRNPGRRFRKKVI